MRQAMMKKAPAVQLEAPRFENAEPIMFSFSAGEITKAARTWLVEQLDAEPR